MLPDSIPNSFEILPGKTLNFYSEIPQYIERSITHLFAKPGPINLHLYISSNKIFPTSLDSEWKSQNSEDLQDFDPFIINEDNQIEYRPIYDFTAIHHSSESIGIKIEKDDEKHKIQKIYITAINLLKEALKISLQIKSMIFTKRTIISKNIG